MRIWIVTALAMAALAFGQEAKKVEVAQGPRVQKIFQVKYANVDSLNNVFANIATVRTDRGLKVLAVEGSPEAVAAIEDALKRLDVPSEPTKNVELTFQMIMAKPAKDGTLPADLQGVQRNLESLFGFKGFQLIETAVMRTRDGTRVDTSGAAPFVTDAKVQGWPPSSYSIRLQPSLSPLEKGYMVRIDNLMFNIRVPYPSGVFNPNAGGPGNQVVTQTQFQFREVGLSTNLDVREGQKVVVGKSNVDGSDGAVILVVTAKVVE